ncbi:MAG: type II toxin-antitoxin system HicA family toxin [Dehalococcoidia bacterium]|nr:type II toxin-antitoxin system HicA family toxin [Dehalococcoidia bacterium]
MARDEKLIERVRDRPVRADFSDVRRLLELEGWTLAGTSGSHHQFTKPGERTLSVPVHNHRVKRYILDEICRLLGLDA